MFEVEIENFQSIRQVSISIDGFTALEGRSNLGKSAIVRAIRCALTGAVGTDFVRHREGCERVTRGRKECKCQSTVRIKTPVMALTWEKGDAVNRYTMTRPGEEPQVYDSVFRGTPDFLLPEFQKIRIGDTPQLLQISEQFNPIFLLDQSGPAVADVLSDVAHLEDVNTAIRLANKDRKDTSSTRKVRESDLKNLLKSLEDYTGLDTALAQVSEVASRYDSLEESRQTLGLLDRFVSEALRLKSGMTTLQGVDRVQLPNSTALGTRLQGFSQVQEFFSKVSSHVPVVQALLEAQKVSVPEVLEVRTWSDRVKLLERYTLLNEELNSAVSNLSKVDELTIPVTQLIQDSQREFGNLSEWLQEVQGLLWVLDASHSLAELPKPDPVSLQEASRVTGLLGRSVDVELEVVDLEEAYREVDEELSQILRDFEDLGLCPTCTQPVHVERCITRAS